MKRKAIETVPYITVSNTVRKKDVKYIAVTACETIGNERHIILEVYKNKKKCLQVPVVRYAASRKDWGVFHPENGEWTRGKIKPNGQRMCWQQAEDMRWDYKIDTILQDQKDLERIKKFFKDIKIWDDDSWWEYFEQNENSIKFEKRHRQYELRQQRLQERIRNTPALKEQELLAWASTRLYSTGHYLYYKIRGGWADICCTACGNVTSAKWCSGETYESMFEKRIPKPYLNGFGHCPSCGALGTYMPQGRVKGDHEEKRYVFTADKYQGAGVVLRYVAVFKVFHLDTNIGDTGKPEMLQAHEQMQGIELARTYFVPGEKPQTDYCKHDPYKGEDYWDDCNLYGLSNISIGKAAIHPDTWANLEGTFLQYSAMEEYAEEHREINAVDYLKRYVAWPQIEMLVKMKMFGIVERMVEGYCGIIAAPDAKRPEDFLGIRKDKMKLLAETRGNTEILDVLRAERREGQCWTCGQVRDLAEIQARRDQIHTAVRAMTVQKLLNNISGYAGCEYGTGCGGAVGRLRNTAITYFDYLNMRVELGYDLTNTVYQKPRDLNAAHHKMVMERNKEEENKRLEDVAQRYPNIRKQYRKLRNRYYYADGDYLIRPARSAEEIVMEGRKLHHCVGGDTYLEKHDTGRSIILLLRRRAEPDIPYITVEIKDEHIVQWYGAHDKKPDERNMQVWLDAYTAMLTCRQNGTAQEIVQLLALA